MSNYRRLFRVFSLCVTVIVLLVLVAAGESLVGTSLLNVTARASGVPVISTEGSSANGWVDSVSEFLMSFVRSDKAAEKHFDVDAVIATNGRIYYSNSQNSNSNVISFLPGSDPNSAGISLGRGFQPAVSPDGTKVAFVDNTSGAVATGAPIMLMNPDGTNRRSLPNPATGFTPAWSPDGTRVAYVVGNDSGGSGGSGDIWVMDMSPGNEGANQTRIPNTRNAQAPNWGVNNFLVWWSRDGVFGIAKLGPVPPTSQIAAGSPLPTRLPGVQTFDVEPVWSPDATKIAFTSIRDYPSGGGSEIYTMDANGGTQTRLTSVAGPKSSPSWAPDGTAIAFEHNFVLRKVFANGSDGASPPAVQTSGFIYNRVHWATAAAAGPTPTPTPVNVDLAMESMTDDPDPVARGSNYNYVFGLRNLGSVSATGVKIVFDPIPTNIRVHPIMLNCSMAGDRRVTCTFPDIAPGAIASRGVTFIADTEGTVNVRATVSSNQTDPNTANNSLTQSTLIVIPADVTLLDPVSPAQVGLGANFTYQLRVANIGPATARAIRLESTLSPELEFVSASAGCVRSGNRITCELGDIVDTCPSPATGCSTGSVRQVNVTARGIQPAVGAFAAKNDVVVTTQGSLDDFTFNNNRTIRTDILLRLELLGLETTQIIQDMANSIPLVQGKETVVRAHIKNLGPGNPQVSGQLVGVRIESSGARTPLGTLMPTNAGGTIRALPNPSRGNLDDSLYFELPENWRQGSVELEFRGIDTTLTCSEPDGTPNCKTTVSLVPTNDLSIKFVFLTFSETDGTTHTPTLTQLLSVVRELYGQLPIDALSVDLVETTITKERACAANFTAVVKQMNDMRLNDCKSGDCKDYYMGLLTDQPACVGTPLNGQAEVPGRASVIFVPTDRSNTRAHEFGHDLGLSHTNFTGTETCGNAAGASVTCTHTPTDGTISTSKNQFDLNTAYGFDIGNWSGTRVYNANTADFMSYAGVRWPSASNYNRMFACFTTRNCVTTRFRPDSDLPPNRPVQIAVDRVVLIDGEVSLSDGATTLGSVFVGNATRPITLPEPGNYAIKFESSQGAEIAIHSFRPSLQSEGDKASISLMLPWNDATKRIVIMRDGVPVASRQASPNPPVVTVTSPNGGEILSGSLATFTWTSSDPDGDVLTYTLEFSTDNGATWKSLAINWNSTSFPVDLTKLPGSSQALFRVTASDGFNSTEDRSNATFTVPSHAPIASITTPENTRLYVGDQTIVLNGAAFDIEEGLLASSSLSWSSDINGVLGTGSSLAVAAATLTEGTHTITLSATDSTARVGSASISIRVFRVRPTFPTALSVGPTSLIFSAAQGSGLTAPQTVAIRNAGDGSLTWSATVDRPWIRLDLLAGEAPSNADVRIDATGIAPGNYSGKVTVSTPNAANSPQVINVYLNVAQALPGTVTGRVVTPSGLGLRNARVDMINAQGVRRTATTSSFGLFAFANVAGGETMTFTISSKRYRFAPRIMQIAGDLALPDFVGLE